MASTVADTLLRYAPHALSFARVLIVVITYGAAWRNDRPLFAALVLLAVLTDIMDGPLARAGGTASRFGANVDSAADLLFYISLPAWTYLFVPHVIFDYAALIATLTILYVAANFTSQYVFGALGVHNRLSRASATAGLVFTFYTIIWGLEPLLLYLLLAVMAADLAQRYGAIITEMKRRHSPPA